MEAPTLHPGTCDCLRQRREVRWALGPSREQRRRLTTASDEGERISWHSAMAKGKGRVTLPSCLHLTFKDHPLCLAASGEGRSPDQLQGPGFSVMGTSQESPEAQPQCLRSSQATGARPTMRPGCDYLSLLLSVFCTYSFT